MLQRGYVSGQWEAFNRVLNLLNTFENRDIAKNDIYSLVSDMRPLEEASEISATLERYSTVLGWGLSGHQEERWTLMDASVAELAKARIQLPRLLSVLTECRDYFADRADADQPSGEQPSPNDEMKILVAIDDAMRS